MPPANFSPIDRCQILTLNTLRTMFHSVPTLRSTLVRLRRHTFLSRHLLSTFSSPAILLSITILLATQTTDQVLAADITETRASGIPTTDNTCKIPEEYLNISSKRKWTDNEIWAWSQICAGHEANFKQKIVLDLAFGNSASNDDKHLNERKLSPAFLKTILQNEPFRSVIPPRGVHISWAYFQHPIDLTGTSLEQPLLLERSFFKSPVNMSGLTTTRLLSLQGSKFKARLDISSASIGGDLVLADGHFVTLSLPETRVDGRLELGSSNFTGPLQMNSIAISHTLSMWDATVTCALMSNARVGNNVEMRGSTFSDNLNLDSAKIEGDLIMGEETSGPTRYATVFLRDASIAGKLDMRGSRFSSWVAINSTRVGGNLIVQDAEFSSQLNMMFVRVDGNLDFRGATLYKLNLTGARVKGIFQLGGIDKHAKWNPKRPKLTLRNAEVGALQDTKSSWPDPGTELDLELDGFLYGHLIGGSSMEEYGWRSNSTNQEDPYNREKEWFIDWLKRDITYTPQPYLHLASVLAAFGHEDKAHDILYEGRDIQREQPNVSLGRWLLLSALKYTIGYGYGWRYFYALAWVVFLVIVGTIVLRLCDERYDQERLGVWYSLDMLLPVIRLREKHYKVDLNCTAVRQYFFVHKILGYVLTFFVIAGLAGLGEH